MWINLYIYEKRKKDHYHLRLNLNSCIGLRQTFKSARSLHQVTAGICYPETVNNSPLAGSRGGAETGHLDDTMVMQCKGFLVWLFVAIHHCRL